jgi:hypothetical protein
MDHFLQDRDIVQLMEDTLEDTGIGWYAENSDYAMDFFSGPTFPPDAIGRLGYPPGGIDVNGFAAAFNHPVVDEP